MPQKNRRPRTVTPPPEAKCAFIGSWERDRRTYQGGCISGYAVWEGEKARIVEDEIRAGDVVLLKRTWDDRNEILAVIDSVTIEPADRFKLARITFHQHPQQAQALKVAATRRRKGRKA